jgi:hypothetical protein
VRALLALVDDLLALARAEAGELRVTPRPTDVHALVREVADEHRAAATAAGLALDVQVDDELPELVTDPARVRQVLGNLLSNAVKYTPRGGTVAVAACVERDGDVECVRVRVADTGPASRPISGSRCSPSSCGSRGPRPRAPASGWPSRGASRGCSAASCGSTRDAPGGACFVLELPAAAAVERVPVSAREHGSRSF